MNLHQLLTHHQEAYITFDRVYCPEFCIPDEGVIEVSGFLGKQERFFGNHLMIEADKVDFNTGQRTIKTGDIIFTVAQFYLKTQEQLWRLADNEGFLNVAFRKNCQRMLMAKLANDFTTIAISTKRRDKQLIRQLAWL